VDYFTKAHEQASTYPLKYRLSPLETRIWTRIWLYQRQ